MIALNLKVGDRPISRTLWDNRGQVMGYPIVMTKGGMFHFDIDGASVDIDIDEDIVLNSPLDILAMLRKLVEETEEEEVYLSFVDRLMRRPVVKKTTKLVYRG